MRKLKTTHFYKWLLGGLLVTAAFVLTLTWADPTAAQPPQQDPQPDFTGAVQSSADGSATIQSQETRLDSIYLGEQGQLEGLTVTPGGLTLAPDGSTGSYTSGIIHSPLAFTTDIVPLWAAELPEGTSLRLETRLSTDGGASWSDWLENPEAYYPVRDNLHSGHLIWVGFAQTALQFKVTLSSGSPDLSPTLTSVTLVFNDASQGPSDGEIAAQMAGVEIAANSCPVAKPAVVSRTQWGCPDGQNSPRRPPVYVPVTHIIIHQSETPNSTHPYNGYAGWVRSIWNYHARVLWWGDVGYNYLIDPNGVIYEGRAGGDDVVGIHDTHNRGSLAIGFIGCYGDCDDRRLTVAEPSQAMLESAKTLMAWKLGQKGIDPLSSATYDGLSNIPVIAGGRDVTRTSSPGANLYNKLGQLRSQVAEKTDCLRPCQITGVNFGRERYNVGEIVEFTVRLADHRGTPLVGAAVTATKVISSVAISTQASPGFGFVDRAGEYDGQDPDTQTPGLYNYTFTATDPSSQRFLPCTATASVPVVSTATPTVTVTITPTATATPTVTTTPTATVTPPTATPTITPTATPTPTPTPPITGTVLRVNPTNLLIPICNSQGTAGVDVENVTNLIAVEFHLRYDPRLAQVIDANPGRVGVQVRAGSAFSNGFVAENLVDTTAGRISFAAVLLGSTINGNAQLISVDWQPLAAGSAPLTLENVLLVNNATQILPFTAQNGQLEVTTNCAGISGVLTLQGRTDHSGINVTSSTGEQTHTQADGSFSIASADSLSFSFPGYLSAQADTLTQLAQSGHGGGQAVHVGALTLLAGDVNADNRIDILDLAQIAKFYGTNDSVADLNGDGSVDILDLVMAASNYGQQGPLTNWR